MDARFIKLLVTNIINRKSIYLELKRINALKIPNEKERVLYFYLKDKIKALENRAEGIYGIKNQDLIPLAESIATEIVILKDELRNLMKNNPEVIKLLKIFNQYDRMLELYKYTSYKLQKVCHHPIRDTKIIQGENSGYAIKPCLLCGKFDAYYYDYEDLINNELSIKDIDLEFKEYLTPIQKEFLIIESVSGNKKEKEIYSKRLVK